MALITNDDVQPWLSDDRLDIELTDDLSEETYLSAVLTGRLSKAGYDTSSWTSAPSTPDVIRGILGRQVAAYRILKVYADQEDVSAYAQEVLLDSAENTIEMLLSGDIDLGDSSYDETTGTAGFYPTDSTEEEAAFNMALEF